MSVSAWERVLCSLERNLCAFLQVHGVVYVVDSSDAARFPESKMELDKALEHPMVVGKPLLVYVTPRTLAREREAPQLRTQYENAPALARTPLLAAHFQRCRRSLTEFQSRRLANKQDVPSSVSEADVSQAMGLDKLTLTRHR